MIAVTWRSAHALEVLAELARADEGELIPIGEIVRRRGLRESTMASITPLLRKSGLISARRGVSGGFCLARPASAITVAQVVAAIDGAVGADCEGVFADAAEAIRDALAGCTLLEYAENERRDALTHPEHSPHMYYI
ncbi:Rrf2 family transcriptional regulator [Paraconexibacter antarcticus]|uniref:Rrf2 family transcriptional regulator n=1 Tax=Paraconexibacter antarcticus TaxID=2949664 RepID=A0ABY5DXV7_9ACTN|nr:Rrf2 family transcriptional regulator [Paraconexibacter antarcticus]UTI66858.1 Rrf2 family transcriptional regulator [Paraconexibacter antarcticus]